MSFSHSAVDKLRDGSIEQAVLSLDEHGAQPFRQGFIQLFRAKYGNVFANFKNTGRCNDASDNDNNRGEALIPQMSDSAQQFKHRRIPGKNDHIRAGH